jgi:inhibitor of growth protein 3
MHYLEDYLELLDPLPEIMREKLTLMRENDLKIQAEFAQLEEDTSQFLSSYRQYQQQSSLSPTRSKINTHRSTTNEESTTDTTEPQLTVEKLATQQQKQVEYDKLVERHQQLIKATTGKINLANESHDIVERYYKKLENDLNKFKMELEADYSGITETLEKRFASEGFNEEDNNTGETSNFDPSLLDMEPLFDPLDEITMSNSLTDDYTNQSTLSYLISSQSRRVSTGLLPSNSSSLFNRKQNPQRLLSTSSRGRKRLQGISSTNNVGKHRKRSTTRNPFLNDSYQSHPLHHILPPSDSDESSSTSNLQSNNPSTTDYFQLHNQTSSLNLFDDETNGGFDSSNVLTNFPGQAIDERRYCFCNEMSYGDMIACDNPTCRREWFHYPCVGIVTPPKGKWFCAECTQLQQQQLQSQIPTTKRASTS